MRRAFKGFFLLFPILALAADPTPEPLLRVETGMHTTLVRRIAVDAPRNRLITASDDKTVRVWQMPEARLVTVLRVPIDVGHEGQLFALAVSPDGRTVVTGGWTGWDWDGSASLYFFDVASGELTRRVGGFKDAIGALAWSADGRHLAVGLQGRGGLHILRLSDHRVVASDTRYLDKLMDLDFGPAGRLVTVALDGMTRLYDQDFRLIGRRRIPGGEKPSSVRYSPDGSLLAVGFIDRPALTVAHARDLSLAWQPDTASLAGQASFTSIVWSSDGESLYAGGDYRGAGRNPVYRWAGKGRAPPQTIPLAANRITEIQQMPAGNIAYAAEDPGLGILGAEGKPLSFRGPDIVDYSGIGEGFRVSADGATVSYPLRRGGGVVHAFSVLGGADQDTARPPGDKLAPPLSAAPGFAVTDWKNSFKPLVNGKPPRLDPYEMSRSYALAPDRKAVLLGTEWGLRLLDREAAEIWSVKLPAVAWGVNISGNGKFALAALSDGSIRWYRLADGREVLAYFPHGNGLDWIAWVPEGYYMSSIYGDNYVGWHLNRGRDGTPDFFRAVQFDRILYRPDVVAAAFRGALAPSTRRLAAAVPGADFDISRLADIAPPRLRLQPIALDGGPRPRLTLRIDGERVSETQGRQMQDYTVFVNNIPVTPARERSLAGAEARRFSRTVSLDLFERANQIRVEAFNGVSMGVAETFVALQGAQPLAPAAGDLYLLAVGANVFPHLPVRTHLAYAARDAEEFTRAVAARGAGHFGRIHTRVLSDGSGTLPERAAIVEALTFVQRARAEDTVVIFLASHGISDGAGNYYFVPRDALPADLQALAAGGQAPSLLPWNAFFDALREAAGRRLLIVDTCQARNIEGRFEAHSLMKRSASSLFSLIVAAKGDEESQEYAPGRHGLFTYALISAMEAGADADRDGIISLQELFDGARPMVERLRDRSIGPQTPQLIAPDPLGDLGVVKAAP